MGLIRDDITLEKMGGARVIVFGCPRDKFSVAEVTHYHDTKVRIPAVLWGVSVLTCYDYTYMYKNSSLLKKHYSMHAVLSFIAVCVCMCVCVCVSSRLCDATWRQAAVC